MLLRGPQLMRNMTFGCMLKQLLWEEDWWGAPQVPKGVLLD